LIYDEENLKENIFDKRFMNIVVVMIITGRIKGKKNQGKNLHINKCENYYGYFYKEVK
jgi:hypothetical protein